MASRPRGPRRWGRAARSPRDSRSLPGALPGPRPPAPGERGRREPRSSRGRPRVCAKSEGSPSEPGPSRTVRRGRAPAAQPDGWAAFPPLGRPRGCCPVPSAEAPGSRAAAASGAAIRAPGSRGGRRCSDSGRGSPQSAVKGGDDVSGHETGCPGTQGGTEVWN